MYKYDAVVGTPTTPQFAEIVVKGTVPQTNGVIKPVINIWHLRQTGVLVNVDPAALVAAFLAIYDGPVSDALNVAYTGVEATCRMMDDPTAAIISDPSVTDGQNGSVRLPLYNTVTLQLKTGFRGRSYRGSKHFAPIDVTDFTGDELDSSGEALWDLVQGMVATMATGITVSGGSVWVPTIISPTKSDLISNPSVFFGADVSAAVLNDTLGTMKRRKERPGVVVV
jgi:hypothetical protein